MIKRIIFDIDDTIFNTKKDCIDSYNEFFKMYDFNKTAEELYDKIDELNYIDITTINEYYIFLKEYLGDKFTEDVFDEFCDIYIKSATFLYDDYESLFKELSEKYELYIWSNWFYYIHINKLNNKGILKYFKKVYTIDTFGKKPDLECYKKICEPYKFEECVMVGDSIKGDVEPALLLGIKSIYVGKNEKYNPIKNLNEIRKILL